MAKKISKVEDFYPKFPIRRYVFDNRFQALFPLQVI